MRELAQIFLSIVESNCRVHWLGVIWRIPRVIFPPEEVKFNTQAVRHASRFSGIIDKLVPVNRLCYARFNKIFHRGGNWWIRSSFAWLV